MSEPDESSSPQSGTGTDALFLKWVLGIIASLIAIGIVGAIVQGNQFTRVAERVDNIANSMTEVKTDIKTISSRMDGTFIDFTVRINNLEKDNNQLSQENSQLREVINRLRERIDRIENK